ncbi:IS66 family transposase [Frankia sp. CiP3]|uniref:IS66 family transposase n=1 Tax=Frankia sp. CiP3 TaxID=2880971 RepID=UPI001EF46361|nr:IS66 family transposase [Frankia sp. CiP3]
MVPVEEMPPEALLAVVRAQAELIAELRATVAEQARQIAELTAKVADLERKASRNSRNSSLSPSSDSVIPGRKPPEPLAGGGGAGTKKRGKQAGVDGVTLAWREDPDRVEGHFPTGVCACGAGLDAAVPAGVARSHQAHDVEPARPTVVQHDLHQVVCGCGRRHVAARPDGLSAAAVSYGPEIRALALYFLVRQHLPVERTREVIIELCGVAVSTGWLHSLLALGADAVDKPVEAIEERIAAEPVAGFDETPLKVGPKGEKRYVLSASTTLFTLFMLGRRDKASFRMFLLGRMLGVVVHDRYSLYDNAEFDGFLHQLCVSHLLRDLQDCGETYPGQVWPVQAQRALRGLVHEANLARAAGLRVVPAERRGPLIAEFRGAVRVGLATVAPAERGRKQPIGRCLLECLRDRHDDVLRFVFDLDVWPTNNPSERDLRPFKTQQKISGRLTSVTATACRLQVASYLSTARKHGVSALHALRLAFRGTPWMPPAAVVPT